MKLIKIKYKDHADFLVKRGEIDGIGASDLSAILGLNEYKSAIEVFYEKIGMKEKKSFDNPSMYRGRLLEAIVVKDYWEYYDPENPDMDSLLGNVAIGRKIRTAKDYKYIVINPKYPWLYCSPDFAYGKDGLIEVKTVIGFAHARWEAAVPPAYIMQLQQQLLLTGKKHGEIAILKDATFFDSIPFEANKTLQESIVEKTRVFWEKVLQAREIIASGVDKKLIDREIALLEPEPDDSKAYEQFLKEKYNPEVQVTTIQGDEISMKYVDMFLAAKDTIKENEDVQTLAKNNLRKIMSDREAGVIDFGKSGKVFYDTKGALQIKVKKL
jgi:predicted phage-related endonuclease